LIQNLILSHKIHFFSAELSYYNNGASAPFAFHHVQDLTNRSTEFIDRIKTQETRGNVDSPESGMDALMQAIVCEGIFKLHVAY
jgi:hypothetical protein